MPPLISRFRLRRRAALDTGGAYAGSRALDDLVDELPEEDLFEDPDDMLDLYHPGSKPEPAEAEYHDLIQDAAYRMAGEG